MTGPRQTEYKQTGKRKSRPSDEDEATKKTAHCAPSPGLEEARCAGFLFLFAPMDADEEEKSGDQDEESTPPVFLACKCQCC
ncbi:hypothetical protein Pcac1_g15567 [Phytophthora cactorum]|nr:hypothetical protein Pcac1_g15567 [Phytophthora cactorum]